MIGLTCRRSGNMGYITDYSIEFFGPEEDIVNFEKKVLEVSMGDPEDYDYDGEPDPTLKDLLKYGAADGKMYDWEDWFEPVAKEFPNVLVVINGDGEESDDLWEARLKGNNFEIHNAAIPPFTNPELIIPENR